MQGMLLVLVNLSKVRTSMTAYYSIPYAPQCLYNQNQTNKSDIR